MKAEEKIIYIPEMESVLIIYQDITKEEKAKEKHYNLKNGDSGDGTACH